MPATTTEGTGPGSVYNVKPPIINGVVKNENLAVAKTAGEVVKTVVSNTYTDFASVTYAPVLESSYVLVEYHAQYSVSGSLGDDFKSQITVNGTEITWRGSDLEQRRRRRHAFGRIVPDQHGLRQLQRGDVLGDQSLGQAQRIGRHAFRKYQQLVSQGDRSGEVERKKGMDSMARTPEMGSLLFNEIGEAIHSCYN